MSSEKLLKQKTQADIQSAMKRFRSAQGMYEAPPTDVIDYGSYDQLSRAQIDQGVIAMVHQLNLSGGSVSDMDLYKLVRTYLWDEGARMAINEIVDGKTRHVPVTMQSCSLG